MASKNFFRTGRVTQSCLVVDWARVLRGRCGRAYTFHSLRINRKDYMRTQSQTAQAFGYYTSPRAHVHATVQVTQRPNNQGRDKADLEMNSGGRRLKQWLIEQINSNIYSGLLWEDEARTMFRIPWKHAGKQDYNQEVDASIFKAWAVFKGKFKEGDKAEPATWKTRLRCALNKSPDFEEVTDRSQLDISEPYKVYRIVPEEEQKLTPAPLSVGKTGTTALNMSCQNDVEMDCSSADLDQLIKESSNDEYTCITKESHSPVDENCNVQPNQEWWHQGSHGVHPIHLDPSTINPFSAAFSQMMICFYYGGKLVGSTLITHSEGCRIAPCQPPVPNALLYGPDSLQTVRFPSVDLIENERQRSVTRKLFGHLDRGVLLRANREGIFIKRLCQSRVFWSGQDSQYSSGVSKLERDAVVKIFDTGRFLQAFQMYKDSQYPAPDPTVTLCFGEEFTDFSTAKNKLIIVQITAVNCQQVLDAMMNRRSQYGSGMLEIPEEMDSDQMARIYQDLCSYQVPQRQSCYRDNLPIIA